MPAFYEDDAYANLSKSILSTSTLGAIRLSIGFAPTCQDGFGIAYQLVDDMIQCNATSYVGRSDVDGYLECLKTSLDDIFSILGGNDFRK